MLPANNTGPKLLAIVILIVAPIQANWAEGYVYQILLAGPLVFVPWGMRLLGVWPGQKTTTGVLSYLIAVLLLLAAYCLPPGAVAGAMAVPWLLWTIGLALEVIREKTSHKLATQLAFIFLPVAAAWMFADRIGWQPLSFDPLIVLLTGVHFHYAGFALALITALLPKDHWKRWISLGLLPGVAGVAVGISSTQLSGPPWIETVGVTLMVAVAIALAFRQMAFARSRPLQEGLLLSLGAIALMAGMTLAFLYGWRFQHQWPWLNMPFMYATHGVLNSLGFSLLSFTAYSSIRP